MTPLEEYNNEIKRIKEDHELEISAAKYNLQIMQDKCDHEFGPLHQIGWVPDIEIMGYTCKLCGRSRLAT